MPKILVVDDDENFRNVYKINLEKRGYEVDLASDGEDALSKIPEVNPDIVLLDILMPGLDGVEVLEKLGEMGMLNDLTVVMLTGVDEINLMKKCLETGAKGYILKGVSMEEIDRKLKMIQV